MRERKVKVTIRLDESDINYLKTMGSVTGIETTSEQVRFALKLLRLFMPRADIVTRVVQQILEENNQS